MLRAATKRRRSPKKGDTNSLKSCISSPSIKRSDNRKTPHPPKKRNSSSLSEGSDPAARRLDLNPSRKPLKDIQNISSNSSDPSTKPPPYPIDSNPNNKENVNPFKPSQFHVHASEEPLPSESAKEALRQAWKEVDDLQELSLTQSIHISKLKEDIEHSNKVKKKWREECLKAEEQNKKFKIKTDFEIEELKIKEAYWYQKYLKAEKERIHFSQYPPYPIYTPATQPRNLPPLPPEPKHQSSLKYPFMDAILGDLKMEVNNDNRNDIKERLLREITTFSKEEHQKERIIEFKSMNNVKMKYVLITHYKDEKSFKKYGRERKQVESILECLTTSTLEGAQWMCNYLAEHFRDEYLYTAAKKLNMLTKIEISEKAAMCMATDCNINASNWAALIRHFKYHSKGLIILPCIRKKLLQYDPTRVKTDIGTIEFRPDGNEGNLKPEKIKWRLHDASDMIEYNMERLVVQELSKSDQSKPTFDYPQSGTKYLDEESMGVIATSDHGGDSAHFYLGCAVYSPNEKKKMDKGVDHGNLLLQILQITCKKDPPEVWRELGPMLNATMERVKNQKLIGVQDINGNVQCKMVPIDATEFDLERKDGVIYLCYFTSPLKDIKEKVPLKVIKSAIEPSIWTVTKKFRIMMAADNLLYAIYLGRADSAPRFTHLNFKKLQEINDDHSHAKKKRGYLLKPELQVTLEKITKIAEDENMSKEEKTKLFGIKTAPLVDFLEVDDYLYQGLHCPMGIFDSIFKLLKKFLSEKVDDMSTEESELRKTIISKLKDLKPHQEELEKFNADHLPDLNDHIVMWKDCVAKLKEVDLSSEERNFWDATRKYHYGEKNRLGAELKSIKTNMAPLLQSIKEDRKEANEIRNKRCKGSEGVVAKFENLLTIIAGIYLTLYHGGSLNGVCVLKFFKHHTDLMEGLEEECFHTLSRRRDMLGVDECITNEELRVQLDIFSRAYNAVDLVFSHLRLLDPSEDEMQITDTSVKILEHIWTNELKMRWTPKAMLTFVYASKQQREFGGLGDKGEDFGERMHQERARDVRRTASISNKFAMMELNRTRWHYMKSDPEIAVLTEEVHQSFKRQFKDQNKRENNKQELAKERRERRLKFYETHKHLAELSNL